jgi:hypothetical protein
MGEIALTYHTVCCMLGSKATPLLLRISTVIGERMCPLFFLIGMESLMRTDQTT